MRISSEDSCLQLVPCWRAVSCSNSEAKTSDEHPGPMTGDFGDVKNKHGWLVGWLVGWLDGWMDGWI